MSKQFVKVALCQRSADCSKQENLRHILKAIQEAMRRCPDLDVIVFPEYSYYEPHDAQDGLANAEELDGPFIQALCQAAQRYHVNIIPGSFPEISGYKIRNTCPFIDRKGQVLSRYSKIHLMNWNGIRESDFTEAGQELSVLDTDFGRIGILIGFDLRFPELARSMALKGVDILFCTSCFPWGLEYASRPDHWDILLESTTLYNLTWVCAANQFGQVNGERHLGRSMVVDPWGTPVAVASYREEILLATLDLGYQQTIRSRVGTWESRRPDIYEL
ncbi:MAG: hypothetical protein MSH10_04105 [Pygmaiobacter massiliensis]|nr:hypothetical protein [Pygmaiobacter massiliensis]